VFPGRDGDEDTACADYLAALLRGEPIDTAALVRRVRESDAGRLFADPADPVFPTSDLDLCTDLDRFDFALQVERRDGLLVMEAVS
jgi:2-phosphosulfolactate phosphatase